MISVSPLLGNPARPACRKRPFPTHRQRRFHTSFRRIFSPTKYLRKSPKSPFQSPAIGAWPQEAVSGSRSRRRSRNHRCCCPLGTCWMPGLLLSRSPQSSRPFPETRRVTRQPSKTGTARRARESVGGATPTPEPPSRVLVPCFLQAAMVHKPRGGCTSRSVGPWCLAVHHPTALKAAKPQRHNLTNAQQAGTQSACCSRPIFAAESETVLKKPRARTYQAQQVRGFRDYLLRVGVHEVGGVVRGHLQGVSLAGLLLRRLDRHARAQVNSSVRSLVLGLRSALQARRGGYVVGSGPSSGWIENEVEPKARQGVVEPGKGKVCIHLPPVFHAAKLSNLFARIAGMLHTLNANARASRLPPPTTREIRATRGGVLYNAEKCVLLERVNTAWHAFGLCYNMAVSSPLMDDAATLELPDKTFRETWNAQSACRVTLMAECRIWPSLRTSRSWAAATLLLLSRWGRAE